ncbi:MAG: universal stress protein [Chloroflexi bacterium]|nr:universal stress protein [Chloroflexota bacterium]
MAWMQRILVPLDGSAFAEVALPHAVALAKQTGASLTLLSVLAPLPPAVLPQGTYLDWPKMQRDLHAETRSYLDGVRQRVAAEGLVVGVDLREGDAAGAIVDTAQALRADVIVMATHGRSGLGRWTLGSVADRVVRSARMPVLLIRPQEAPAE